MREAKPSTGTPPWRRPLDEVNHEPAPRVYRGLVRFVRLFIPLLTTRRWEGMASIPQEGGALVVANHISNYDTLVLGEFLIYSGRWPRFLGKSELWKVPVVGWLARKCEQIPVERNTSHARDALVHAKQALDDGKLVVMYPEGTITKDPDGWPMTARHGAARLALMTGDPVIPVAQIGAAAVLGGAKLRLGKLFSLHRRPVAVLAGKPIDLSDVGVQQDPSKETLELVTVRIMDAITELYEQLRGEKSPEGRFDVRQGKRVPQVAAH